jgi:acetyl-CoA synthetase
MMISPLPGVTATKPGSATRALPGISADVVDENGESVPDGGGGLLVLTEPWPGMLRGLWRDEERFRETYWSRFADRGFYFAGDGAKKDEDGDLWLLGRVDDVMNISGHRISTTEVESALVSHPAVAEAAVVGADDPTTGQAIVAFVILRGELATREMTGGELATREMTRGELATREMTGGELATREMTGRERRVDTGELRDHVAKEIGAIAKPRQIIVVTELPKTRSGKIMRRLLRDVAEKRAVGDVTTLADSSVMELIAQGLSTAKEAD